MIMSFDSTAMYLRDHVGLPVCPTGLAQDYVVYLSQGVDTNGGDRWVLTYMPGSEDSQGRLSDLGKPLVYYLSGEPTDTPALSEIMRVLELTVGQVRR